MARRSLVVMLLVVALVGSSASFADERLVVYAVNYPLQYFALRIAGDHAEVVFPAPPDVDPAFWQPDAATIADFQRADLILLNGAGYARWVRRASLPRRKLVDTSAGFADRYIQTEGAVTHSHGREGEHSHAGTAFTTWLDLRQAAEQARAIREALVRRWRRSAMTSRRIFSRSSATSSSSTDSSRRSSRVIQPNRCSLRIPSTSTWPGVTR